MADLHSLEWLEVVKRRYRRLRLLIYCTPAVVGVLGCCMVTGVDGRCLDDEAGFRTRLASEEQTARDGLETKHREEMAKMQELYDRRALPPAGPYAACFGVDACNADAWHGYRR